MAKAINIRGYVSTWAVLFLLCLFASIFPIKANADLSDKSAVQELVTSEEYLESDFVERLALIDAELESIESTKANPNWVELVGYRLEILINLGNYSIASTYLESVRDRLLDESLDETFRVRAHYLAGFISAYAGNIGDAMENIASLRALSKLPGQALANSHANTLLTIIEINIGYPNLSADRMVSVVNSDEFDSFDIVRQVSVLGNTAYALNKAGRYDDALDYLDRAFAELASIPDDAISAQRHRQQLWHNRSNVGLAKIGKGEFADLAEIAEEMSSLSSGLASPLLNLRSRYIQAAADYGQGDYAKAVANLEDMIVEARALQSIDLITEYYDLYVAALTADNQYQKAIGAVRTRDEFRRQLEFDQAQGRIDFLNAEMALKERDVRIRELELQNTLGLTIQQRNQQLFFVTALGFVAVSLLLIWAMRSRRSLKQLAERLAVSQQEALAAADAKAAFLANMSHEIRTPLNGVLGMAQLLTGRVTDDKAEEYLQIIQDSGQTLLTVVNDVLDLSKIEAGKIEITPTKGDLGQVIQQVVKLHEPTAKDKDLPVSLNVELDGSSAFEFDAVRVRQCVSNLLSNAIKFTDTGSVSVRVTETAPLAGADDDAKYPSGARLIHVTVTDTGIGISPEQQENLFSEFHQADGSITRKYGGTGLGLAISQRLARLMGGDLTVESSLGEGSTFILTFLAIRTSSSGQAISTDAPGAELVEQERALRVLIVDDNTVNRMFVKSLLEALEIETDEAENGEEAIQVLENDPHFDAMLLDIHMPVLDGPATITRIRNSGADYRGIKVMAFTANTMDGDRQKYIAMGMDGYVPKPIVPADLVQELASLTQASNA